MQSVFWLVVRLPGKAAFPGHDKKRHMAGIMPIGAAHGCDLNTTKQEASHTRQPQRSLRSRYIPGELHSGVWMLGKTQEKRGPDHSCLADLETTHKQNCKPRLTCEPPATQRWALMHRSPQQGQRLNGSSDH